MVSPLINGRWNTHRVSTFNDWLELANDHADYLGYEQVKPISASYANLEYRVHYIKGSVAVSAVRDLINRGVLKKVKEPPKGYISRGNETRYEKT